jgi:hypothetical protein
MGWILVAYVLLVLLWLGFSSPGFACQERKRLEEIVKNWKHFGEK